MAPTFQTPSQNCMAYDPNIAALHSLKLLWNSFLQVQSDFFEKQKKLWIHQIITNQALKNVLEKRNPYMFLAEIHQTDTWLQHLQSMQEQLPILLQTFIFKNFSCVYVVKGDCVSFRICKIVS